MTKKYSLQGTTQGNVSDGRITARQIFHVMFKLSLVAAMVVIIKSTTRRLSSKDTFVPCVEVAGNLVDLSRADGFHRQLGYPASQVPACARPVPLSSHSHRRAGHCLRPSDCPPAFQSRCPHGASSTCRAAILGFGLCRFLSACQRLVACPASLPSADKQPLPVPK